MIYYLAFYDTVENKAENRKTVLSATNKLQYIFECMQKLGMQFEVLSASGTNGKKPIRGKKVTLFDGVTLHLPMSLGNSCMPIRVLGNWLIKIWLFLKLLRMKKTDTLMVYHSLYYMKTVSLAKKLRKFRLVLEAEEVYGDVAGSTAMSAKEIAFFQTADAYIFPTQLLNEKVNHENKPYVLIHGTYKAEKDRNCKFNDGKIHAVYAGTFDPRKGGGVAAEAAAELDSRYHIHIIGFGTKEDTKNLQEKIAEIAKTSVCAISFDGLKSGDEYIRYIQSCDIGFSTQSADADFNETSFPSKVLSYLANGLRVVSVRIPVLEKSAVSDLLYYYDVQTPENIANAVKAVDMHDGYDSRKVIEKLDRQFQADLKGLLGSV